MEVSLVLSLELPKCSTPHNDHTLTKAKSDSLERNSVLTLCRHKLAERGRQLGHIARSRSLDTNYRQGRQDKVPYRHSAGHKPVDLGTGGVLLPVEEAGSFSAVPAAPAVAPAVAPAAVAVAADDEPGPTSWTTLSSLVPSGKSTVMICTKAQTNHFAEY